MWLCRVMYSETNLHLTLQSRRLWWADNCMVGTMLPQSEIPHFFQIAILRIERCYRTGTAAVLFRDHAAIRFPDTTPAASNRMPRDTGTCPQHPPTLHCWFDEAYPCHAHVGSPAAPVSRAPVCHHQRGGHILMYFPCTTSPAYYRINRHYLPPISARSGSI